MSIIDKLKLNKYTNMVVINEPSDYDIFTGKETTFSKEHDAIFIFVETLDEMVKQTNFIIINEELLIEKDTYSLHIRKRVISLQYVYSP